MSNNEILNNKKLNIIFYVGGLPFDGNTLEAGNLGGSESMGLQAARALAKRGHKVTMFCNCKTPGIYAGVNYIDIGSNNQNFYNYLTISDADVVIAQRMPGIFGKELNSKLNILWQHDLAVLRNMQDFKGNLWNIDEVWCLSDFHLNQQSETYEAPKEAFWKTRNGIEGIVLDPSIKRKNKRLFYAGRPERGTDILLETMPKIWEKDPEVELYLCGYDCPNASIQPFYDSLIQKMGELGDRVKWLGALTKDELYRQMQEASLYVYNTEFEDTYCLLLAESQACGLPIVTTPMAALPETMHPEAGVFVGTGKDGEARTAEHQYRYANEVVNLLNNPEKLESMRKAGIKHAENLSIEKLAEEWEEHIYELFEERTSDKERLAKHFYNNEDIKALWSLDIPKWNKEIKKTAPHLFSQKAYEEFYNKKSGAAKQLEELKTTPKISVIIPTVRGEAAADTIKNLRQKSNVDHEYIVVENGESGKYPSNHKDFDLTLINNKENLGFTKAVNQGIKQATCDYLAIVNDDFRVYSNWDYSLTKIMKDKDIHYLSPNAENYQSEKDVAEIFYSSFMIVTKKLIDEVGLFDERFFLVFQDVDFQERMRDKGYECYVATKIPAVHFHTQGRKFLGVEFDNKWEDVDHDKFLEKWKDREDVLNKHQKAPKKVRNALKDKTFSEIVDDKAYVDKEYESAKYTRIKTATDYFKEAGTKHILNYGSGIGTESSVFYNELPVNITNVNISKKEQEYAQDYIKKMCKEDPDRGMYYATCGSPKDIKLVPTYDGVYCGEVLEHVSSPKKLIDELEALVPDGSLMVFTTPIPEFKKFKMGENDMTHLWNIEKADLQDLFSKKLGFITRVVGTPIPEDQKGLGSFHRWHVVQYRKMSQTIYCPNCRQSFPEPSKECSICGTALQKPDTGRINMDRKLSIQSPMQTVSVCMMTQNSENLLHRTMKSVKDIADEIIVYDAGSTDSTKAILSQHTNKIYDAESPLDIGFDEARNRSKEHASGDWILWIDSDEEFLTPFRLYKYLRPNSFKGYSVRQHHFSAQPPNVFEPDLPVRLFRNEEDIKFFGVVHEHPHKVVDGKFDNDGVGHTIVIGDVDIAHDGYLTEHGRRGRFHRNFRLIEKDRRKYPDRTLGKFLYIRDMLHWSRYILERTGGRPTNEVYQYCQIAVNMYKEDFLGKPNVVSHKGVEYYSEALRILGKGLVYTFSLGVSRDDNAGASQQKARFETPEDFIKYYQGMLEGQTKYQTGKYF